MSTTNTMGTELYYFSGAGNSLHVARELQKRLPGTRLLPIAALLQTAGGRPAPRRTRVRAEARCVGFVFPIHGLTAPVPVQRIIGRLDLGSARYLFAVATRGGSVCQPAFRRIDRLLGRQGRRLDSWFVIDMPTSDPKLRGYVVPTAETFQEVERRLPGHLDAVVDVVGQRRVSRSEDLGGETFPFSRPVNFLLERLVLLGMAWVRHARVNRYFYADSRCTGCGTCALVCLSGKIRMEGKHPVWRSDVQCHLCYACLNYCPEAAVQIRDTWYMKSYTTENGRYPHPYATAREIAAQKQAPQDAAGAG